MGRPSISVRYVTFRIVRKFHSNSLDLVPWGAYHFKTFTTTPLERVSSPVAALLAFG
jgi:hypothetical protein